MENIGNIGIASVAAITVICYLAGLIAKALPLDDRYIPIVCGVCGAVLGVAGLYLGLPDFRRRTLDRAGSRHCQRPCGHGGQPGIQAAGQVIFK